MLPDKDLEATLEAVTGDEHKFRVYVVTKLMELKSAQDRDSQDLKWVKRVVNPVTVLTAVIAFFGLISAILVYAKR
jgi:hypothetical protein